jgi:glycosyltransferase involved in cell wall biosynthesis
MKLSVIVPAYNEEKTIGPILEKLLDVSDVKEIIVVDDCSSDKTSDVVRRQKNPFS